MTISEGRGLRPTPPIPFSPPNPFSNRNFKGVKCLIQTFVNFQTGGASGKRSYPHGRVLLENNSTHQNRQRRRLGYPIRPRATGLPGQTCQTGKSSGASRMIQFSTNYSGVLHSASLVKSFVQRFLAVQGLSTPSQPHQTRPAPSEVSP